VPNSYTLLWDSSAERPGEPTQGLWLTASALRSFLFDKQNPTAQAVFDRDLFVIERRCGIEIDTARKTASKGKLFGVDFVRLQPGVGFLLEVELIGDSGSELPGLLPAEGFLYLGGERRTVHYRSVGNGEVSEYTQLLTPPQQIGPQFTLLLVTPTLFRVTSPGGTGWLPDWINEETLEGGLPDAPRFRILSAALGKPIPIGGWDLAKRQPKALRWAVPAGSAYYCELLNGGDGAGAYHGRVISALHPEVGMGQVLVGRWPDAQ
jgi:CRISPR-associated protein Cmr3